MFNRLPACYLICIVQVFFSCFPLQAQIDQKLDESWRWVHFTTDDGLPSNEVYDVVETSDGLAWALTAKGVAWFDGFMWNQVDSSTISGLPRTQFTSIEACEGGDVLLTKTVIERPVMIFRGNRTGFRNISSSLSAGIAIHSIVPCGVSAYMVWGRSAQSSQSVLLLLKEDGDLSPIPVPPQLFGHSDTPRRLWVSPSGTSAWFNSFNGLWLWDGVTWDGRLYTPQPEGDANDASLRITRLAENVRGDGLFVCRAPNGRHDGIWEWYGNAVPRKSATEISSRVTDLAIASDGTAIVAYSSGDIRLRTGRRWSTLKSPPGGLRNPLFVKFRRNDDLWVGTREGLSLVRISSTRWERRSQGIFNQRDFVNEVLVARDSTIWLATADGLEHLGPGKSSTWVREIGGKRLGSLTAVNQDSRGNIWIGSGAGLAGVYQWDGRKWTHWGAKEGFPAVGIHKIDSDRDRNLWFSALGSDYTRLYSPQAGSFVLKNGRPVRWGGDQLSEMRSYGVAMAENGTLWFATRDGLTGVRGRERWRSRLLSGARVFDIAAWRDGIVATTQKPPGLVYIDSTNRETAYTTEDGLVDIEIWDMMEDAQHTLWVATRFGLSCNRKGEWFTFGPETGLPLQELYSVRPVGARIYLGSAGGLITLNLDDFNIPYRLDVFPPIIENDLVHLRWDVHSLWGTVRSDQIETRYRVDGKAWSSWSKFREGTVRDLPWGGHRFDVQYKHFFADSTTSTVQVFADVQPPFYYRTGFFVPIAGLALGVVYLLVVNFRRKVAHERTLRSSLERIAKDLHDEIGSNMGTIALISQRLQRQPGILSGQKRELGEITSTSLHTAESLREIVWYINPQHDSLGTLTLHFKEIASRMLRTLKYTFEDSVVDRQRVVSLELRRNLYMMFKEILHNIVSHSRAQRVTIIFRANSQEFQLTIEDDGIGFDVKHPREGSGLHNLRSRCEGIGGALNVESEPGKGTTVRLSARFT